MYRRNIFHVLAKPRMPLRGAVLFLAAFAFASAERAAGAEVAGQSDLSSPAQPLGDSFARLIESAIPTDYEKRKDWGKTRNITTGIDFRGIKTYRRKTPVRHGVWKHYKLHLPQRDETLAVSIDDLRPMEGSQLEFTLTISAYVEAWARVKTYKYGIHLGSVEMDGRTRMTLTMRCQLGLEFTTTDGAALRIRPHVSRAHVDFDDFHLRRISKADGPLVHEMGDQVKRFVEQDLNDGRLAAKLNRAIEKKRKQLTLSPAELTSARWWPLAATADAHLTNAGFNDD